MNIDDFMGAGDDSLKNQLLFIVLLLRDVRSGGPLMKTNIYVNYTL